MLDDRSLEEEPIKTPEQYKADRLLCEAIEACIEAYIGEPAKDYTLTDFIALSAIQRIADNGVIVTRYPMYVRDGDIPWYKIQGLMKVHQVQIDESTKDSSNNG